MPIHFTVEYIELKNGKSPFKEFVLSLPSTAQARVFATINYFLDLKNENLPIKESLSKHLEDGIFELRIASSDTIVRALYFYQKGAKIIITHGFIKKTQKTPRKEIERAKEFRDVYQDKQGDERYDKL
ncbi:MAG: type II toxin-antitoxin system RelE/ParE family toxin [Desulfamplus sp.]|nr:type II toxin-antitoxin system RelE/ParE family toxin [Desulfamplus sp.]